MSVEFLIMRLSPKRFEYLQAHPDTTYELFDALYTGSAAQRSERGHLDARDVFRGSAPGIPQHLLSIYLDEFTTSLLVDRRSAGPAPFTSAITGEDGRIDVLEEIEYGYGPLVFYDTASTTALAAELAAYPNQQLEARFMRDADSFRAAGGSILSTDQALLAHQHRFADLVRQIYQQAAHEGDVVLIATV